jgi:hypothetical protein
MRPRRLVGLFASLLTLAAVPRLEAAAPIYHGVLAVRPAGGGFDKNTGDASLRVKNWILQLRHDTNGIAPDREPIQVDIGDTEQFFVPAGQMHASRNGKRFTYRNPRTSRGVRSLAIQRIKNDPSGTVQYRVAFSVVGVNLSSLVTSYPLCTPLAVIVGDDDGFSGVELDRPGGFNGSRVRVAGACISETNWPWVS